MERLNWSLRTSNRRYTKLSNGFSRKLRNHEAAVALNYFAYNFVRIHRTLRMSPAMAAGVTTKLWEVRSRGAARSIGIQKSRIRGDSAVNAGFIDMTVPFAAGGLYSTQRVCVRCGRSNVQWTQGIRTWVYGPYQGEPAAAGEPPQ